VLNVIDVALPKLTVVVYPEDGAAEESDWEELELSVVKGEEEMDVGLLITLVVELE
jgi:hypothetical protein